MTARRRTKLITPLGVGKRVELHEGRSGSWFMHREEAEQHVVGHTGMQALDLILGVEGAHHRLPLTHTFVGNNRILSTALRKWLNETS